MYLLDTNIWLERLLEQERSQEVGRLLSVLPSDQIIMTDFTLHSIGVILGRLGSAHVLAPFVEDIFIRGAVRLASVPPASMNRVVAAMQEYRVDFDDAYQYVAAEREDVQIVSYDKDLDRTNRKRMTPAEILLNQ